MVWLSHIIMQVQALDHLFLPPCNLTVLSCASYMHTPYVYGMCKVFAE